MVRASVPALRDRRADIPLLVEHFAARFGGGLAVAPSDLLRLIAHRWPGNVSELCAVIERGCVMASGSTIQIGEL